MPSWWNSLDVVSRISTVSNLAIAVLGVWAFIVSKQKDALSDESTAQANRNRDTLISANQLKTDQAILETARANQIAAEANERVKTGEVARLQLEKEVAIYKLKIADLEEHNRPRHLGDQRRKLVAILTGLPKVRVDLGCPFGNSESADYMTEIGDAFKDAGFTEVNMAVLPVQIPSGVNMMSKTGIVPEAVGRAWKAFLDLGLGEKVFQEPTAEDGVLTITVGVKQ